MGEKKAIALEIANSHCSSWYNVLPLYTVAQHQHNRIQKSRSIANLVLSFIKMVEHVTSTPIHIKVRTMTPLPEKKDLTFTSHESSIFENAFSMVWEPCVMQSIKQWADQAVWKMNLHVPTFRGVTSSTDTDALLQSHIQSWGHIILHGSRRLTKWRRFTTLTIQ